LFVAVLAFSDNKTEIAFYYFIMAMCECFAVVYTLKILSYTKYANTSLGSILLVGIVGGSCSLNNIFTTYIPYCWHETSSINNFKKMD